MHNLPLADNLANDTITDTWKRLSLFLKRECDKIAIEIIDNIYKELVWALHRGHSPVFNFTNPSGNYFLV
jgi:hypothetical protein